MDIYTSLVGKKIKVSGKYVWTYRPQYGNYGQVLATLNDGSVAPETLTLTGLQRTTSKGNKMIQALENSNVYVDVTLMGTNYTVVGDAEAGDAQSTVEQLIENNKKIFTNNLICARFADKFDDEQKLRLVKIQANLIDSNTALQDNGLVTGQTASYPKGVEKYVTYLNDFMTVSVSGIGIVINLTTIIVTALVLTAMSVTAYFIFKAYLNQSIDDLHYSEELMKVLDEKLTDEERKMLYDETAGYVNMQKLKTATKTTFSSIKTALLVVGGGFLGFKLFQYVKAQSNSKPNSKNTNNKKALTA